MTRELQRATFNRSALVRVLSDTLPEVPDPKYDFGERLGQWLDFSDALTLFSVLNTEAGSGTSIASANSDLPAQLARVRRNLSESIHNDGVFSADPDTPARIPFPTPLPNATPESAADFFALSPLLPRPPARHEQPPSRPCAPTPARRWPASRRLANNWPTSTPLSRNSCSACVNVICCQTSRSCSASALTSATPNTAPPWPTTLTDDPSTWTQPGSWLEAFCHDAQTAHCSPNWNCASSPSPA